MAQDDERRRKPWFFTIGHNIAVSVVFPKIVRYGFHIKINITVDGSKKEGKERFI